MTVERRFAVIGLAGAGGILIGGGIVGTIAGAPVLGLLILLGFALEACAVVVALPEYNR